MNKKFLVISIFILMIVLSIGAVSAEDADDAIASNNDNVVLEDSQSTISGSVSGGVDVVWVLSHGCWVAFVLCLVQCAAGAVYDG